VPRRRCSHPTLTVRVVHVGDPDAAATFGQVLDLLADAITDLSVDEARAEVAARLGVCPDAIDHERGHLSPADRAALDGAALRGVA
jgi:hypothetical protein